MKCYYTGKKKSPESVEKSASAIRGIKRPPEVVAKITDSNRRKREKDKAEGIVRTTSLKGTHLSEERKKQISATMTGVKLSPERAKRSADSRRGLKRSEEAKANMKKATKLSALTNPNNKLNYDIADAMRQDFKENPTTITAHAKKHGIGSQNMGRILRNQMWVRPT